ncbi:hypothetical protein [Streptomyces monashensis]|uniref:Uncharacterized protein n=1 Tax=Streptomyces monashensis TaxID=1678012 RepID=A0A1S2QQ11_9ACTN|nr:hypothetical protein [Streptomyces monashensis]OIK07717.1 hypothetical protein BIV23_01675 [Streptomyces monashensis]
MRDTSAAERLLEVLAQGCPPPPQDGQVQLTYRPVVVNDQAGWPRPGTITAWWAGPDGAVLCRLRLSGAPRPRWVVYDPDRIALSTPDST